MNIVLTVRKHKSQPHIQKNKYITFAKRFRQAIIEKFAQIKVYIKSTASDAKVIKYHISREPTGNIIDEQREPLRIGAFEITIWARSDGFTKQALIFSKLKTNWFPNLPYVLSKIWEYVPKCNLAVNIWDNIKDLNDKPNPERAEGMKIQLKCSFKDTQAGIDLDQDLYQIDSEKVSKTVQKRKGTSIGFRNDYNQETSSPYLQRRKSNNSLSRGNIQLTSRPFSAKSDLHSFTKTPYNRRNFSNRMLSSQQFLHGTPSMKTLAKRPQTAISHAVLQSTSSFDRLKTLDSHHGGARTLGAISTYNRSRTSKKKYKWKVNDLIFEATVNHNGIAIFNEIPKTWYSILANENDFFKSASKRVCLPQEAEIEDKIEVYIPMERQDSFSTTVYMIKNVTQEAEKIATDTEEYEKDKDHHEKKISILRKSRTSSDFIRSIRA